MNAGPLQPFDKSEALTIADAASRVDRKEATIRLWCARYRLGRHVGGRWAVSKVALRLFVNGEGEALASYLSGRRDHPAVVEAFEVEGVAAPAREPAHA